MKTRFNPSFILAVTITCLVILTLAYDAFAQSALKVKRIVQTNNSLHYVLGEGTKRRALHLYNYQSLKAAIVTNRKRQILTMTVSINNPDKTGFQKANFIFTPNAAQKPDSISQSIVKSASIAKLPLPKRSQRSKWKNSSLFLNSMVDKERAVIVTGGLKTVARGSSPVKDALCDPPISVQLNSALNACFRALCDYYECVEKNGSSGCFDEESKASAFCLGSGNNEFKKVD